MNIKEILEKYLDNQSEDFYDMENKLSDYYDKILDHQELLSQLSMTSHHRILSKALQKAKSNNKTFPYSKFIDFSIYVHENQNSNDIHSLLSHFSIFDFTISDIQKLQNIPDFDDRYFQQRPHELIQMILENHQLKSKICELEQRIQNISILEEMSSNIKTLQDSMKSIDSKINDITTQTSNSKIIENKVEEINNQTNNINNIESHLNSIDDKINEITTQTSNSKIIENKVEEINNQTNNINNIESHLNSIDDKINEITTQTSNSKIIENKVEEINNQTNNINNIENHLNSIDDKINEITTQTSNSKIIEKNIQTINNNVDKIQQIDSSLIKQIRDISNENQTNIIQHVDILHQVKVFPRIPEKPYSGVLTYCKSINSLTLTSGVRAYQGALDNILKSSGFYLSDSSNEANHWIEFDFDCKVVNLVSYEIQSINDTKWSYYYPISWKILGSNDRNKWDHLDIRPNCNELSEANRDADFVCNFQSTKYYRYIRFLQTSGHNGWWKHFGIARIEFYGNVF